MPPHLRQGANRVNLRWCGGRICGLFVLMWVTEFNHCLGTSSHHHWHESMSFPGFSGLVFEFGLRVKAFFLVPVSYGCWIASGIVGRVGGPGQRWSFGRGLACHEVCCRPHLRPESSAARPETWACFSGFFFTGLNDWHSQHQNCNYSIQAKFNTQYYLALGCNYKGQGRSEKDANPNYAPGVCAQLWRGWFSVVCKNNSLRISLSVWGICSRVKMQMNVTQAASWLTGTKDSFLHCSCGLATRAAIFVMAFGFGSAVNFVAEKDDSV